MKEKQDNRRDDQKVAAGSSMKFLLALVASLASTSLRQLLLVPLHLQQVICYILKENKVEQIHSIYKYNFCECFEIKAPASPDVLEKAVKCGSNPSSEPEKNKICHLKNKEDELTKNFGFM